MSYTFTWQGEVENRSLWNLVTEIDLLENYEGDTQVISTERRLLEGNEFLVKVEAAEKDPKLIAAVLNNICACSEAVRKVHGCKE